VTDEIPDLAVLRAERAASDADYIEQLEEFSLGQEQEIRHLQRVIRKLVDVTGASLNGDWMEYGCGEFTGRHSFEPDERAAYEQALADAKGWPNE
jgi:hypothetical protein